MSEIDLDFMQRTINQTMDIWVNPEIERRRKEGLLPENFKLKMAQVIF